MNGDVKKSFRNWCFFFFVSFKSGAKVINQLMQRSRAVSILIYIMLATRFSKSLACLYTDYCQHYSKFESSFVSSAGNTSPAFRKIPQYKYDLI